MLLQASCPPAATTSNLQAYLDAGFNAIIMTEDSNPGIASIEYLEQLKFCQEMGLDVYIRSYDGYYIPGTYEYAGTDNCYLDLINFGLNNYPAIKGFYMWDEPSYSQFDEIYNELVSRYNQKYKNEYTWQANLLPSYASNEHLGVEGDGNETAYQKYVKAYFEEVYSKIEGSNKKVSLDHYPLRQFYTYKYISTTWLSDLAVVANEVKKYGGDLGCCIQAYTNDGDIRKSESSADIGIQVYVSMAFGAKYFDIYHYTSFDGSSGLVEKDGELNDTYYHVKDVLTDLRALEHVYLNFDWQGVMPIIGTNNLIGTNDCFEALDGYSINDLPSILSVKASEDALVGHFVDDNTRNGYMIANFSDPISGDTNVVELEFSSGYSKALIYISGEEVCANIIDGKLSIELPKGEGAFVVPY